MTSLKPFRRKVSLWACRWLCLSWAGALTAAVQAPAEVALDRSPRISPDYTGITLPPNIAPLRFRVDEPGAAFQVEFRTERGERLQVKGRGPRILIPIRPWQELVRANAGQRFYWDVRVKSPAGWSRFRTITNHIAAEALDPTLVYRWLKPLYNVYVNLAIHQRDLESFVVRPVLENRRFEGDCLNCHTFLNHRAYTFALNIRRSATNLHPMLLVLSNEVTRVDKTMGYLSWHPSGRAIAYTGNKLTMLAHTTGEARDVYDAASDIGLYRLDLNGFTLPPAVARPNQNENWPAWSADGRYLYFSRADPQPVEKFRAIQYDLLRVAYDLDRDLWGEPELLVSAKAVGQSANQPQPSPDGRFVLYNLSPYGGFPVYQPASDLYLLDLETRQSEPARALNSDQSESWHGWSANGRWVVFSSKRMDGLFARPFFAYLDATGRFHKPFVLPQEDPGYYDTCLHTFNVPQLVDAMVAVPESALATAVTHPRRIIVPQPGGPGPRPGSTEPANAEASMYQSGRK